MEIPGKRRILNRIPMDDSVARFVSARAILDATAVLGVLVSVRVVPESAEPNGR
jgi:hypothetical protein